MERTIPFSTRQIITTLLVCTALIVAAHLAATALQFLPEFNGQYTLNLFFNMNNEGSIPTWFSGILLFINGLLLLLISGSLRRRARKAWWSWGLLGLIFVFLSLDEVVAMHDQLNNLFERLAFQGRDVWDAWIPFGLAFAALAAVIALPLLRSTPRRTVLLFILAGAIFIGGSVVVEFLDIRYLESLQHKENYLYLVMTALEESMEMLGAITMIYALLDYITRSLGGQFVPPDVLDSPKKSATGV